MSAYNPDRPSPIAGSWYSANPEILGDEIDEYIQNASIPPLSGEVIGLIAPHAGYYYSGSTAGYAYRSVLGKTFELCAVFSPLHDYLPYNFLTTGHEAYTTPLGRVKVDAEVLAASSEKLGKYAGEHLQPVANDREHSLEIQLPFLQKALASPFNLLPVMVRTHDPERLQKAARAFAETLMEKNVLLIASTDLSHFYTKKDALTLDAEVLKQMTTFSPQGVLAAEQTGKGFACGAGAVALVLWISQLLGATVVTLLNQSTSADASGDTSRVVGYGALAITR